MFLRIIAFTLLIFVLLQHIDYFNKKWNKYISFIKIYPLPARAREIIAGILIGIFVNLIFLKELDDFSRSIWVLIMAIFILVFALSFKFGKQKDICELCGRKFRK